MRGPDPRILLTVYTQGEEENGRIKSGHDDGKGGIP
jgi:hypothetical protein